MPLPSHLPAKIGIVLASLICLPQFAIFVPYYDSVGRISQTTIVVLFILLSCIGAYIYLRNAQPAARNSVYLFIGITAGLFVLTLVSASGLINSILSAMSLCLAGPLICYLLLAAFPDTRFVRLTKKLAVIFTIAAVALTFGMPWYANYAHMTSINAMALLGWAVYGLFLAPVFVAFFLGAGIKSLGHETDTAGSGT